jgi:histidine triad (HIT) family protein
MSDCIFCKIVAGEIPAETVYQDDEMIAFNDISPKAPVHILVVPRDHIPTLNEPGSEHEGLLGRMMLRAAQIAKEKEVAEDGYRVLVNCNSDGGQVVFHLHMHLIGGRSLGGMA